MDQEEGEEQDITVKKVFLHPKWDIRNETTPNGQKILTTHDIALIELSRPVQFTSKVRSMCLDNGQPFKAGKAYCAFANIFYDRNTYGYVGETTHYQNHKELHHSDII